MNQRATVPALLAVLLVLLPGAARPADPTLAPEPAVLVAQADGVDDSDLGDEMTLREFMDDEIAGKSKSIGAAIGLSLVPGGGFGLMYADRKAAAWVPILLSAAGYGLGVAYLAGAFNKSSHQVCTLQKQNTLPLEECHLARTEGYKAPDGRDQYSKDPNANDGKAYFEHKSDYEFATVGEDVDGTKTGLLIIGATYAATTILGAIWSASAVAADNENIRKQVESTVQAPHPFLGYNGRQGLVGLSMGF